MGWGSHLEIKGELRTYLNLVAFSRVILTTTLTTTAILISLTSASYGFLQQTKAEKLGASQLCKKICSGTHKQPICHTSGLEARTTKTINLHIWDAPEKLAQLLNKGEDLNRERSTTTPPRTPSTTPPTTTPKTIPTPATPATTPQVESSPVSTPTSTNGTTNDSIQVNKIEVIGSTIFSAKELEVITKPIIGTTVSVEELRKATDAITQLYLDRGYITSRAVLTDQSIKEGVVQIQVIEGSIEAIEIEGTSSLNPEYVRSRVKLGAGKPLSSSALEDQLRLLRLNPLFSNVEASLKAGSELGKSIVVVRVTEANPFTGLLSVDNYSPPSVSSERLGIAGAYRNLTGNGDEIAASYYFSTRGGSNVYDFSYRLPLNAMDGTLQVRTAFNNNRIIQEPFKQFNISGESQLYEVTYRQPLIRTPREEFALSLGFAVQNGQTFTFAGPTPFGFGPDAQGNSRTRTLKFGQDYTRRDVNGAWALRSLFSLGINVFDATINSGAIPDGRFFVWFAQVQRVQSFSDDDFLIAQVDLQLTPNGLLPSQQFVIGGSQFVRGYRQNVRAADNGLRFSLENRWIVQRDASANPILQLTSFFDLGWVWNVNDNPNRLQQQRFLAGVGVGLLWEPIPRINVRIDYGVPLVNLQDRGNNAQDDGLYFSVGYRF